MSDNQDYVSPKAPMAGLGEAESDSIDVAGKAGNKTGKAKGKAAPKSVSGNVGLTPVESLLFFNIIRFSSDLAGSVDWDSVAVHSNLKNEASARVRFRQIAKKYNMETSSSAGGGGRKRPAAAVQASDFDNDEQDDDYDPTYSQPVAAAPRKRAAPTTGRARAKKAIKKDADGAEEGTWAGQEGSFGLEDGAWAQEDKVNIGAQDFANTELAATAATPVIEGTGQAVQSIGGGSMAETDDFQFNNPFPNAGYNNTAPGHQQQFQMSYLGGAPQSQASMMPQPMGTTAQGNATPDQMSRLHMARHYDQHIGQKLHQQTFRQQRFPQQDRQQSPFHDYPNLYQTSFQMGQGQGRGAYGGNPGLQSPYTQSPRGQHPYVQGRSFAPPTNNTRDGYYGTQASEASQVQTGGAKKENEK